LQVVHRLRPVLGTDSGALALLVGGVVYERAVLVTEGGLAVALVVEDGLAAAGLVVPDVQEEVETRNRQILGGVFISRATIDEKGADGDGVVVDADQRDGSLAVVDGGAHVPVAGGFVGGGIRGGDRDVWVVRGDGPPTGVEEATGLFDLKLPRADNRQVLVGEALPLDGPLERLVAAVLGGVDAECSRVEVAVGLAHPFERDAVPVDDIGDGGAVSEELVVAVEAVAVVEQLRETLGIEPAGEEDLLPGGPDLGLLSGHLSADITAARPGGDRGAGETVGPVGDTPVVEPEGRAEILRNRVQNHRGVSLRLLAPFVESKFIDRSLKVPVLHSVREIIGVRNPVDIPVAEQPVGMVELLDDEVGLVDQQDRAAVLNVLSEHLQLGLVEAVGTDQHHRVRVLRLEGGDELLVALVRVAYLRRYDGTAELVAALLGVVDERLDPLQPVVLIVLVLVLDGVDLGPNSRYALDGVLVVEDGGVAVRWTAGGLVEQVEHERGVTERLPVDALPDGEPAAADHDPVADVLVVDRHEGDSPVVGVLRQRAVELRRFVEAHARREGVDDGGGRLRPNRDVLVVEAGGELRVEEAVGEVELQRLDGAGGAL